MKIALSIITLVCLVLSLNVYHRYLCQSDYQTAKEFELSNLVEMIHKQEEQKHYGEHIEIL